MIHFFFFFLPPPFFFPFPLPFLPFLPFFPAAELFFFAGSRTRASPLGSAISSSACVLSAGGTSARFTASWASRPYRRELLPGCLYSHCANLARILSTSLSCVWR